MGKSQKQAVILSMLLVILIVVSVPVNATNENNWTLNTLEVNASVTGVVAVNDKLYLFAQGTTSAQTILYDPPSNTLINKRPMANPRSEFGTAYLQGKVYTFGGTNGWSTEAGSVVTGVVEVYDPVFDTWQTETSMPTPRSQITANVVGEKIYIIGGRTGGPNSIVSTNEAYNPSTKTWVSKASMPIPVCNYASTVLDNKIYIMGGSANLQANGSSKTNFVQVYDSELDSWSIGTPMPVSVWQTTASSTSGLFAPKKIYVFGGLPERGFDAINVVQIYDPSEDYWSTTTMPMPRVGASSGNIEDVLFVVGGSSAIGLDPNGIAIQKFLPIGYESSTSPEPTPSASGNNPDSHRDSLWLVILGFVVVAVFVVVLAALLWRKSKLFS